MILCDFLIIIWCFVIVGLIWLHDFVWFGAHLCAGGLIGLYDFVWFSLHEFWMLCVSCVISWTAVWCRLNSTLWFRVIFCFTCLGSCVISVWFCADLCVVSLIGIIFVIFWVSVCVGLIRLYDFVWFRERLCGVCLIVLYDSVWFSLNSRISCDGRLIGI